MPARADGEGLCVGTCKGCCKDLPASSCGPTEFIDGSNERPKVELGKNIKDLTGNSYGRWKVVSFHGRSEKNSAMWSVQCECGQERVVLGASLISGNSKSCGCLAAAIASKRFKKHGGSGSPEFIVWLSMRQRCSDKNHSAYKDYGARGISVCDRWQSFENFFADMGVRPVGMSLDRKDNDGNYEPGNCQWTGDIEQARNRRSNRLLTFRGETLCTVEWAERTGIQRKTITFRLDSGWSVEDALTAPVRGSDAIATRKKPEWSAT